MDGELGVESTEGKESRFWFNLQFEKRSLAANAPSTEVAPDPAPTQAPLQAAFAVSQEQLPKLKILLAEDSLINQKVTLNQLKQLDCSADVAANGKEVLDLLTKIRYDIILMDCQMPVLDGYDTTQEICRLERQTLQNVHPLIIITMTANAMQDADV